MSGIQGHPGFPIIEPDSVKRVKPLETGNTPSLSKHRNQTYRKYGFMRRTKIPYCLYML
jgi:hypothetical protein